MVARRGSSDDKSRSNGRKSPEGDEEARGWKGILNKVGHKVAAGANRSMCKCVNYMYVRAK